MTYPLHAGRVTLLAAVFEVAQRAGKRVVRCGCCARWLALRRVPAFAVRFPDIQHGHFCAVGRLVAAFPCLLDGGDPPPTERERFEAQCRGVSRTARAQRRVRARRQQRAVSIAEGEDVRARTPRGRP